MATHSLDELWKHDEAFGSTWVVGADEAGRGAWAGPIVGAAVALDIHKVDRSVLAGMTDSKKLTPAKKTSLLAALIEQEEAGNLKIASLVIKASEIDKIGIQAANLKVLQDPLREASRGLTDCILLADAFKVPGAVSIIKGDAKSAAIAAASIIAKTLRDQLMERADQSYPIYGFASHKGYGAKKHSDAILESGLCQIHRKSFKLPGHDKVPYIGAPNPGSLPQKSSGDGFFDTSGF